MDYIASYLTDDLPSQLRIEYIYDEALRITEPAVIQAQVRQLNGKIKLSATVEFTPTVPTKGNCF